MTSNATIARVLNEIADILEIQGVEFKPNAYRRAARSIEALDREIEDIANEGKLAEIPGVGTAIGKKIEEILRTGELRYLARLRSEIPPGLSELLRIPDVGPKTVARLWHELRITTIGQLKAAAERHELQRLKGFGAKSEQKILQGIAFLESSKGRVLLGEARPLADALVEHLRGVPGVVRLAPAGSLRRGRDTVGDIDILVATSQPEPVMEAFRTHPAVQEVLMSGPTKTSVLLTGGIQADVRVVPEGSYGAALQYFTGSKDHNVELRRLAQARGLKLNEYGLFPRDSDHPVAGRTEEEIYGALELPWIPPELRETRGEIAAAQKRSLPSLVKLEDIRGDLHCHTNWSDGIATIEQMAAAQRAKGYEYAIISDHSQSTRIANGLSEGRLKEQLPQVRNTSEAIDGFRLFTGTESDILADGSLDFPKPLLEELDIVVGSIHSRFKMDKGEMTERLLTAIGNEHLTILGHPTGRLLGEREGYTFDTEKVFEAARDHMVALEVNSFPNRLDLSDGLVKLAIELGAPLVISTDAHSVEELDLMPYGVTTARRGWAEPKHIWNTRPLGAFLSLVGLA